MFDQFNIYLIKERHKKQLQHVLDTCPEIGEKWRHAKELLNNSIFRDYLDLEIVIWDKRAGVAFNKLNRPKRAMNRIKAYRGLYNRLFMAIDNGKPWIQLDKSGYEIFTTMN